MTTQTLNNTSDKKPTMTREEAWDEAYTLLVLFKREHGHVNAPDGSIFIGFPLGTWLQTQRREYRLKKMSEERITLLEDLGMAWSIQEVVWERNFALTQAYKIKHGTANVPVWFITQGVRVGSWMKNQRDRDKQGTLLPERRTRLIELGVRL